MELDSKNSSGAGSYRKTEIRKSVDWFTIVLYIILVVAGWFSIYGASYGFDSPSFFDITSRPGSQLMWIALSFVIIFVILMLDSSLYDILAYFIYAAVILLLVATIFMAPDIKGSHSWLVLGPLRLQPAEFAKFATALAVSKLMNTYGFKLSNRKDFMRVMMLFLLPMILIMLQKETGSALVYLAFFLVLYREGMSGYVLLTGICAIVFFIIGLKYASVTVGVSPLGELIVCSIILAISIAMVGIRWKNYLAMLYMLGVTALTFLVSGILSIFMPVNFAAITLGLVIASSLFLVIVSIRELTLNYIWIALFSLVSLGYLFSVNYVFSDILEPHHQVRIKEVIGLEDDPTGAGYNVNQSMIAIGSGGLQGKGFLNGTQTKLKYVPEQDTDFIFCTVGEEEGFIGSVAVIILFAIFIMRLVVLAERQDSDFSRIYGYCVASIFFFHFAINIGMVTGLTPVIGIPLPFFSYGGSSLWGFTILLFIFLRFDAQRKVR